MNCTLATPSAPPRAILGSAWIGLCFGLTACALCSLQGYRATYAAFGPSDLTAWAGAIAGAISAFSTSISGAIIVWTKVVPRVRRVIQSWRSRRHRRPPKPHGPARPAQS